VTTPQDTLLIPPDIIGESKCEIMHNTYREKATLAKCATFLIGGSFLPLLFVSQTPKRETSPTVFWEEGMVVWPTNTKQDCHILYRVTRERITSPSKRVPAVSEFVTAQIVRKE
jgi:hypothetical protein